MKDYKSILLSDYFYAWDEYELFYEMAHELSDNYSNELEDLFWELVFTHYDPDSVITDKQKDNIKYLAWEEGHSSGWTEVFNHVTTFIGLFVD